MPVKVLRSGLHFPPQSSLCPPLLNPQLFFLKSMRAVLAMLVVLLILQLVLSPQGAPKRCDPQHLISQMRQHLLRFQRYCCPLANPCLTHPVPPPPALLAGMGLASAVQGDAGSSWHSRQPPKQGRCLLSMVQASSRSPDQPHQCCGVFTLNTRPRDTPLPQLG